MLGKKIVSIKKLAKKVKVVGRVDSDPDHFKLLKEYKEEEKKSNHKKSWVQKKWWFCTICWGWTTEIRGSNPVPLTSIIQDVVGESIQWIWVWTEEWLGSSM